MKTIPRTVLLLCTALSTASVLSAELPDPERGRLLYENHCEFCHTPAIHARPGKLPLTRNELASIVEHWRRQQNLPWAAQDTEDVVEYLNRTRYHFAPR